MKNLISVFISLQMQVDWIIDDSTPPDNVQATKLHLFICLKLAKCF